MSNIKELISKHPEAENVLKRAGKIALDDKKQIYVVGGFVRDLFIQNTPKEIDLMIIGDGIEFAEKLANDLGVNKVIPFKQFSTAKIPYKKIGIEVAAARKEKYDSDSRKPKEVIYTDLEGDLIRRDFTINSMAVNIIPDNYGELYDPYNGILDLQSKKIITPLNPDDTFSEDPLRMLRAAYFASKFNFEIDTECYNSIIRQKERISIVSQERITTELCKILSTSVPSIGLVILQETGLMKLIFPEIDQMYGMDQTPEWNHKDIFFHTMQVVDNAAKLTQKMEIRFAALVHDIAKPATRRVDKKKGYTFHGHDAVGEKILNKVIKRMKLSNNLGEFLKRMTLLHLRPIALAKKGVTDSAVRRLMVAAGDDIDDLMTLCRADITTKNPNKVNKYMKNFERVDSLMKDVKERDLFSQFQSPVRGKEIMELFNLEEGKKVGKLKKEIEEAILDGKIDNNYDDALNYLNQIKDKYNL
ncbi:MAG: tRNA nucleotidyltransferase [Candidatus Marinimicrobia bacterium]|nr:tRNA nucleotidyltransferase [Candidatus Neomarinimicrobiota bacterium]